MAINARSRILNESKTDHPLTEIEAFLPDLNQAVRWIAEDRLEG